MSIRGRWQRMRVWFARCLPFIARVPLLARMPFRLRLTLGFGAAMIVLFGGLALLLHTLVETSLDAGINRELQVRAADLASALGGRRTLPPLPEVNGAFVQILDPGTGAVRDATPGHERSLLTPSQLRSASSHATFINLGLRLRLRAQPASTSPPAVLVVGAPLTQRDRALTTLSELLFAGGPALLLLTCLAGYVLAARALLPVERMRAEAGRIAGAPQGTRLPVPAANDELRRLGETLNQMLARVDDALEREHDFVANVGHQLRTPLAILKLELELALAAETSPAELHERMRSAAEEVERITKLAQDLLLIARAEQGRLPPRRDRLDTEPLLSAIAARFRLAAASSGRTIRYEGPGEAQINADPTWIEQALTNLVANALRHGSGTIVLRAAQYDGSVELHVLDDGPGFEPDFLEAAFERFSRAPEARPGTGLGLSIARAIAEAHGGSAAAANRAEGGADVWLTLPRA